jgi:YfiH family protein
MAFPAGWLVPAWPAPDGVRAVCSTREGGVSASPFDSLNLGDHVGDDPDRVGRNRAVFRAGLGVRPVFLKQVHGTAVASLGPATPDGTEADGCIATDRGVACTIMVADCLPILLSTADGHAVAAAHAGWRGLAGEGGRGIVESVCESLRASGGDLFGALAWLGPCIGPTAFEVGPEVKAAFEAHDPGASALFEPRQDGKWLADLPGLARRRLAAAGVTRVYGNDGSARWCTVGNPSRFFSHRRDRVSGRFAASIWLD